MGGMVATETDNDPGRHLAISYGRGPRVALSRLDSCALLPNRDRCHALDSTCPRSGLCNRSRIRTFGGLRATIWLRLRPAGTRHIDGSLFTSSNCFSEGVGGRALSADIGSRRPAYLTGVCVLSAAQKRVWRRGPPVR